VLQASRVKLRSLPAESSADSGARERVHARARAVYTPASAKEEEEAAWNERDVSVATNAKSMPGLAREV